MYKITILCLYILLLNSSYLQAQDALLDSLKTKLELETERKSRVDILNEMAGMVANSSPEEAIKYSSDARTIAEEDNYREGLALAFKNMGLGHYFLGDYTEAVRSWESSLTIYDQLENNKMVANLVGNLGSVYYTMGQPERAVQYYLRSLKIAEEINDTTRIATLILNLGSVYSEQKYSLDTAINYYRRAMHMGESLGYNDLLGVGSMNLGQVYYKMEEYDSALFYFEKSLQINTSKIYISSSLNDMGRIYAVKGNYEQAIEYQQKALKLAEEENALTEKTKILLGLASTYMEQKNYPMAIKYLEQGKDLAREIGLNVELSFAYDGLSESYSAEGDFRNAYKYLALKEEVDDALYRSEAEKKTNDLMFNYHLEKKQDEIEILEQKSLIEQLKTKRQRVMTIGFALFGLFVLILVVALYHRMRFIRRVNKKIESQKNEIAKQNELITDSISYAQRIQSALLPSEEILGKLMPEHFVLLRPKDIVSGDFYWIREVQDHLVIVGADCTGHGVPGAFMSMLGISILNEMIGDRCFDAPGAILDQLRKKIKDLLFQDGNDTEQKDGMDAALVILNKKTLEIYYSGAHNPLYIITDKNRKAGPDLENFKAMENGEYQLYELKADMQPVGVYWEESPFATHSVRLQKGDSFYIFSDGFVDQYGGENRKKYKSVNFKKLLLSLQEENMLRQKEILEHTFDTWRGEYEQIDDVSVIGVRL